jgi:zinc protease
MRIFGILLTILFLVWNASARATDIEEVTSKSGIKAWLVEDHKLPLIALHFAFRGGVEQDPADKQGISTLTMALLDEGAGDYDANAFQQQLSEHSVLMRFAAGRDALSGNIKTLREERQTAFDLLHLALTRPRFDPAEIDRARDRQLTRLRFQMGDPDWQARYAMLHYVFANHPYSERSLGSAKSLGAITPEDIKAFAAAHLARDNLLVAVAGDITPDELKDTLDKIFGDLPVQAKLAPVPDVVWPKTATTILVPRDGTQTDMMFAEAGPKRNDPDWYAAEIADYILGGGGFSSRLMQEVRDKNGLTYGIDTGIAPMEHAAMIVGSAATDNEKTDKAWKITLDVWSRFFHGGAKPDEIAAAKDYLTGYLPLTMTSTDAIADMLVDLQIEHLGRDYLTRRDGLIRAAGGDDIMRVIKKWFDPQALSLVMVGKPQGMTPVQTQPQVRE